MKQRLVLFMAIALGLIALTGCQDAAGITISPGGMPVAAVSAGGVHTMVVMADGSLWVAGENSEGQLGDGTSTRRTTFVKVMEGVAAVSAGEVPSVPDWVLPVF